MKQKQADHLLADGMIDSQQHSTISSWIKNRPFPLFHELRVLLYAGVLLFTAGVGILIYQNIDTIGHTAVIILTSLVTAACYAWCFRHALPFSWQKTTHPVHTFDYVLLLACLLFLTLEGYLQYQYNLFGHRYGLASLFPAVLFLYCAFRFDHLGVLSLGITLLATFVGFTLNPGILLESDFSESRLVYTGIGFGIFLIVAGTWLEHADMKKHFRFTCHNYAIHILGITLVSALFAMDQPYTYLALLAAGVGGLLRYSTAIESKYMMLMALVYGYFGCTWLMYDMGALREESFALLYFVMSGVGIIWFLLKQRKLMKGGSDGI